MQPSGQTIHLGQEVLVVEVGAAVQDYQRQPLADAADVEPGSINPHIVLPRYRPRHI
jgi:hypothetical protein